MAGRPAVAFGRPASDALQTGFIPIVVRDAVGDRHPDPHEAHLRDIAAKLVEVRSLAGCGD